MAAFSYPSAKSSALAPLLSLNALLCFLPIATMMADAPTWALIATLSIPGLAAVVTTTMAAYLLVRNPDALRSESYVVARQVMVGSDG